MAKEKFCYNIPQTFENLTYTQKNKSTVHSSVSKSKENNKESCNPSVLKNGGNDYHIHKGLGVHRPVTAEMTAMLIHLHICLKAASML